MRILIDNFIALDFDVGTQATVFCRLNSKSKLTCSSSTSLLLLIALYFQQGGVKINEKLPPSVA